MVHGLIAKVCGGVLLRHETIHSHNEATRVQHFTCALCLQHTHAHTPTHLHIKPPIPTGNAYWAEGRPSEKGRQVIVRKTPDGVVSDVTPGVDSGFNVRTRVHEYGGGASWMGAKDLYFTNFAYVGVAWWCWVLLGCDADPVDRDI